MILISIFKNENNKFGYLHKENKNTNLKKEYHTPLCLLQHYLQWQDMETAQVFISRRIKKKCYIYTIEHYSAIRKE